MRSLGLPYILSFFFFCAYTCTPSGLYTRVLQPCQSPFYIYILSSKCHGFFLLKIITANIVSHLAWSGHMAHPASLIQINLWTYIFTFTADVQCWICQPWMHFGFFLLSESRTQFSFNFFSKIIMKGMKLYGYCSEIDSYAIFLTLPLNALLTDISYMAQEFFFLHLEETNLFYWNFHDSI